MERSRTIENREWNGSEQWKIWKSGMERSLTIENREWNGPQQWKIWKSGMERAQIIENMEIGIGTVTNNKKNRIREWEDPVQ